MSADLQAIAEVDKKLATLSEAVQRNLFELEDVAVQMRSYLTNASFEPDRIDAVEERLGLLNRLKRKYAPTIGEILELKEAYDREIVQLENAGETRVSLLRRTCCPEGADRFAGADPYRACGARPRPHWPGC